MTLSLKPIKAVGFGVLALPIMLSGCADLAVTHVTEANQDTVKGVHYFLPQPYLQVTPKSDGTVSVTVLYLPDHSHEYAVATSSFGSNYEFQIARDSNDVLSGVEYKADTTAVAQQLAASSQAAVVQAYNLNAANQIADQGAVNTAQAAVDSATSNLAAAQAALQSDTAKLPSGASATATQLASDNSTVQQDMAKLTAAQQVLARVQSSSQLASSNTISAATPLAAPSALTAGTVSAPAAPAATVYNLPSKFAPALFAVNDKGSGDAETVTLYAVVSSIPDTTLAGPDQLNAGVVAAAQPTFATVGTALGPPSLSPATQTVKISASVAVFTFSRAIDAITSDGVSGKSEATPPVSVAFPMSPNPLKADNVTLNLNISALAPNQTYDVTVPFKWSPDGVSAHDVTTSAQIKITTTP